MKLKLFSTGILIILLKVSACQPNDCGDLGSGYRYMDITSFTGNTVRFNSDSYDDYNTLSANAQTPYYDFGLLLFPLVEYFSLQQKTSKGTLLGTAYACSPIPPQPSEEIADIAIFSNADYAQASSSKVLAAGDTLNSIFEIYDYYSGRIVGLPDFLIDDELAASEQGFALRPSVAVANPQQHQFTVHYRLTNGEFYTYQSASVELIP